MFSREMLEARELAMLAPYAARAAQSAGRTRKEAEHPYRTAFQRDRDRIVHARSFRRLQGKTQVFTKGPEGRERDDGRGTGDHLRTRLTHTLEVAQIARSIARTLGLNEDLVETVALAHDIGHAPFGHAGGDALDECMRGRGGFEHNRQALRIVDILERRPGGTRGLNLTHEVRDSLAKHDRPKDAPQPLLEAQLVDVADGIAYGAHDLDDGVRAGLIEEGELASLAIVKDGAGAASTAAIVDHLATDLASATAARLDAQGIASVAEVRAFPEALVGFSAEVAAERRELACFLGERVYRHAEVLRSRERPTAMLKALFEAYSRDLELMPEEWRRLSLEFGRERAVCDYLSGMTDRYARQRFLELEGRACGEAP